MIRLSPWLVACTLLLLPELAFPQTWTRLTPGASPPFRCFGASTVSDPATNRLVLFGGNSCAGFTLNDTWVLTNANGIGGAPQWIGLSPSAPGGFPTPRANHTAVYDPNSNRMIIFSGCFGGCLPTGTDVWVLTNANGVGGAPSWIRLFPSGPAPAGRNNHKAVYDAAANRMIVFGGQDGGGSTFSTFLETWVLANANGIGGAPSWTLLAASGGPPPAEYISSATYDAANNRMIVFGGITRPGATENSVWVLSNANGLGGAPVWTNTIANGAAGSPSPRAGSQTAYVPASNSMLAYDGGGLPDLWRLSNANGLGGASAWTQLFPVNSGPAGSPHLNSSVYDPASGRLTVFANSAGGGAPNETWVLSDLGGAPAPTLTGISVSPETATLDVGEVQQFTATASYSDGSSQLLGASSAGLSLVASTTFGGAGDQFGNGITAAGGAVHWAARDAAANDGRHGSHNLALSAQNFSQALGGNFAELTGVAVIGASAFAAGGSRPPGLTVDNVGGWENKPIALRAPAGGGTRDWLAQMTGPGFSDRVFGYSGTEWSSAIVPAAGGGALYVTGGGENWGGTSHYAMWLARVATNGARQWTVTYGAPGQFTAPGGLAVVGSDVYVAGGAGNTPIIRKYFDNGASASLQFGNSYGTGVFTDIAALDGYFYAVGRDGGDVKVVKIDAAGATQWNRNHDLGGTNDTLNGVVAHAGRLFAVGQSSSNAVLVEIDPATGARVGAALTYGNAVFNRVATDTGSGRLYAIGAALVGGNQDVLIASYGTGNSGVTWTSSNPGVAEIGANGLATAYAAGSTTILATYAGFSDSADLAVLSPNAAPQANAGPDQVVEASSPGGAAVLLDGSGSSDADGDSLSYSWSGAFGAASGGTPVVVLPLGLHVVTLTVSDGQASHSDEVLIAVHDTTAPALTVPGGFTVEAMSAAGSVVHYAVSASDLVDLAPSLICSPPAGSTFGLDSTTVSCTATDFSGNATTASFTIRVVDTTAPELSVPAPITIYAGRPDEAVVTFAVTATDSVDADVSVLCAPFSGATFALGTTTVFCSAADDAGNGTTGSFAVTVIDNEAPVLTVPPGAVASATGPEGAAVIYAVSAMDGFDTEPEVTCVPSSGSTFALGTTTVECTAADDSGNAASADFTVTVIDDGRPQLAVPSDMTVNATTPSGAQVDFAASASDTVDTGVSVSCSPVSGSIFAVGTTVVSCAATDDAGNTAMASFNVTVLGAAEQLDNAGLQLASYGLPQGTANSLGTKLDAAEGSLAAGNLGAACNQLKAFINEVKAQSGKALTKAQADALIATARQIQGAIGC